MHEEKRKNAIKKKKNYFIKFFLLVVNLESSSYFWKQYLMPKSLNTRVMVYTIMNGLKLECIMDGLKYYVNILLLLLINN